MKEHDNVTVARTVTLSSPRLGLILTALGILAFSLSFTATRAAVHELGPITVGAGRGAVAAVLAAAYLRLTKARRPTRSQWRSLLVVAIGVVVGSPILSAVALLSLPASHGSVIIGLAPTMTAVVATLRDKGRPSAVFWLASIVGTAAVVAFGLRTGHGQLGASDLIMLVSVVLVAVGYAEGGRLSVTMGGARVVSWALVLSFPLTASITTWELAAHPLHAMPSAAALGGFAYVSVVSMFLGFFAYYQGLAMVGVAKASQLQLLQVPLGALWSALLLGERISLSIVATSVVVVACAAIAQRSRASVGAKVTSPLEDDTIALPPAVARVE